MSKGSKQRPCDKERFDKEFERIFTQRMKNAAEHLYSTRPDPAPTFARVYNGPQDPDMQQSTKSV